MRLKVAHIGKSARLHALIQACCASRHEIELYILSDVDNARLKEGIGHLHRGQSDSYDVVADFVSEFRPDLAIIGPEEPLAAGIGDLLEEMNIACFGPKRQSAALETSKSFARSLLKKYRIEGNPEFEIFSDLDSLRDYIATRSDFVIKPDGLTGGKGVRVSGEHFDGMEEAILYCETLFKSKNAKVVIEEKLEGEEFSYQSVFDGKNFAHTFPIQDHKRAFTDDTGPNTGGMGSYSCADKRLPFLTQDDIIQAQTINEMVGRALCEETEETYKGVLYGGFMATAQGLRVIEYNARFGDPEVMNVLPILTGDFIDMCLATTNGYLSQKHLMFENKATVCKYIVPNGYPNTPNKGLIDVRKLDAMLETENNLHVYYGAAAGTGPTFNLTGSRAIGLVGVGKTLAEAEKVAEEAASMVTGPVFHRPDIGTSRLIEKRVRHMQQLRRRIRTPKSIAPHLDMVRPAAYQ